MLFYLIFGGAIDSALDNLQFLFWIFARWVGEYFEIDDLAPGTRN